MSLTLNGSSPAVTFPDGTTQSTAANITAPYTANGVVYASSTSALATGSNLTWNGTALGVGTSSPSGSFQVGSSTGVYINNGSYSGASILSVGSGTLYLNPNGNLITVGGNGAGYASTFSIRQSGSNACFSVEDSTASYSYLYVNSSGNVGIGTTSPTRKLDVANAGASYIRASDTTDSVYVDMLAASSGGWIGTQSNHAFLFQTNNTERMRLDTSGNLLLGTTSGSAQLVVNYAYPKDGADWKSSSTSTHTAISFANPNGVVGTINTAGSTTAYNTSSDQRLKTNIVDAPLGNIDQIKVRSFDWKVDNSHQTYGMIAQELLEVAPYAVSVSANPDEMMGVDYSKLVPMMIKEIQSLKAEVATLKGA